MTKMMNVFASVWLATGSALASFGSAHGGEVEIVKASARGSGTTYSFDVTLRHGDEGWDHYANIWEVLAPNGDILGTRVLYHPHVDEQPFTRSLSGVEVPAELTHVMIRAGDKLHGMSEKLFRVELEAR